MASKSNKSSKPQKTDYRARRQRIVQAVIVVLSIIIILSWVLSLVVNI